MPNGGPTPSCLYCTSFELAARRCTRHNFDLGTSIPRILCNEFSYRGPENDYWAVEVPDLNEIPPNTLYIWVEISFISPDGVHGHEFNLFPFVSIEKYQTWTADQEGEILAQLHETQRELYRKRGYKIT
jgi:hypothetical protein